MMPGTSHTVTMSVAKKGLRCRRRNSKFERWPCAGLPLFASSSIPDDLAAPCHVFHRSPTAHGAARDLARAAEGRAGREGRRAARGRGERGEPWTRPPLLQLRPAGGWRELPGVLGGAEGCGGRLGWCLDALYRMSNARIQYRLLAVFGVSNALAYTILECQTSLWGCFSVCPRFGCVFPSAGSVSPRVGSVSPSAASLSPNAGRVLLLAQCSSVLFAVRFSCCTYMFVQFESRFSP